MTFNLLKIMGVHYLGRKFIKYFRKEFSYLPDFITYGQRRSPVEGGG